MVPTLDVLLHEASENNFKRKIIRSAVVRPHNQKYLKIKRKPIYIPSMTFIINKT